MNKLTNFRKFVFASIITLFGVISWGQEPTPDISGAGTAEDPFVINTQTGWDTFENDANYATYWASGVYAKLNGDFTVSNMVGTSGNKYQGTFDGNWHTLTFNKGTEASRFNANYCAPFRYISAATIKNLTVEGTIISNKKFASGIAGSATGICYITNCTSSIHILCNYIDSSDGDCTHGGFVGREESTGDDIIFENCLFDGWIKDTNATKKAIKCAGFVAWAQGKVHYTTCYMVGEIDVNGTVANFHRNGTNTFSPYDYENIRYLTNYTDGVKHGPEGFMLIQSLDNFSKKYVADDKNYYVPCTIRGLEYIEYNNDNPVTLTPEVYYFSKKLGEGDGNDYTVDIKIKDGSGNYSITPEPYIIQQAGDYKVTITGTGSVYFGLDAVYFSIIGEGQKWSDLQALINDAPNNGTIELTRDYVATSKDAGALQINKNITIDLKGHTINRNLSEAQENGRVIEIASGFNVTIKDGTITGGYKVAKNEATNPADNDGGGIYNLGDLTLTGVTVTGNKCIKKVAGGSYTGRGGGIYCGSSGSFTMIGGKIRENVAEGGGGGIFVDKTPSMKMNGFVSVSLNTTKDKGAGMRLAIPASTTYKIVDCIFSMNSATYKANSEGGAIYFLGENSTSSVLELDECEFTYNSAYSKGGAIFSYSGTTIATNCVMNDNLAYDAVGVVDEASKGGSLYLQKSTGSTSIYTMDGGRITYSGALQSGGAVFVENGATFNVKGNVKIKGCSVYKDETNIDNNVYLDGSTNVIHVVGPLDSESEIYVTKTGGGSIMDGNSANWSLSNFSFDDDSFRVKIGSDGKVELYSPYLWNNPGQWDASYIIKDGENYTIKAAITIPKGCVATPTSISLESHVNTTGGEIIIEDGGQLVYGTSIPVTIKKNISKATTDENGWYTISSSVHDDDQTYVLLSNIKSIIENSLNDMYLYDEAESYWRNRKTSGAGFDRMERGRGYLYRNGVDVTVSYVGKTNVGTLNDYTLSCQANNDLRGFNLVGNPYAHSIAKGSGKAIENTYLAIGYYVLTNAGEWMTCTDGSEIKVNQGILVQATDAGNNQKLVFNDIRYTAPSKDGNEINKGIEFKVENSEYSDEAYAMFEKAVGLNKISHPNEDIPMLYIRKGEKDYAIATMSDNVKSINLNFEAKTFGRYTLSVKPQGGYRYLHLIDRLAEKDIDLLVESEYSFIGSPADNANRFIVRLEHSDSVDEEEFAYQSGNDIVVAGEGELQVFDVMGRMVMKQNVNGVQTVNGLSKGVYIMRLNDMTQKIVIR